MTKREDVRRSVLDSLKNLQTEYIDLYLIHWPGAGSAKGLGAKNKEYRKLAWDELTALYKYALFTLAQSRTRSGWGNFLSAFIIVREYCTRVSTM